MSQGNETNVLVTGASRGVGIAITRELLRKGYRVLATSRTKSRALEELEREVGVEHLIFKPFDLSRPQLVQAELFTNFIDIKTPLHGFVNNGAQAYDDMVTNMSVDRLDEMFRTNVYAPLNIVKYAIRNMIFNRVGGSIVHISSISVHTGYKGLAMYAASKGALEAFSKNTAREWGEKGVRSNCIVAGFMDTNMSAKLGDHDKSRIYQRTALKRATDIESVASTTEFLLSEASKSITGQNLFVDSGTI